MIRREKFHSWVLSRSNPFRPDGGCLVWVSSQIDDRKTENERGSARKEQRDVGSERDSCHFSCYFSVVIHRPSLIPGVWFIRIPHIRFLFLCSFCSALKLVSFLFLVLFVSFVCRELKHRRFLFTEVTISVLKSMRMRWRVWQEVTDVRRVCFPFALLLETIYNSEIVTSGWRLWIKNVCA